MEMERCDRWRREKKANEYGHSRKENGAKIQENSNSIGPNKVSRVSSFLLVRNVSSKDFGGVLVSHSLSSLTDLLDHFSWLLHYKPVFFFFLYF